MFNSKSRLGLALVLSASLLSCTPASLPTASSSAPNTNLSASTLQASQSPGLLKSQGPNVQQSSSQSARFAHRASIKGKITLPFAVTTTQLASAEFSLMAYLTGLPVHAQEASEDSLSPEDLETLQATVNGESVEIEIVTVEPNLETDETVLTYEIGEAPVSDGNDVIEIQTDEGTPVLGAITDLEENQTTEQNIDTETTSILNTATEIHGSTKLGDLTIDDLIALAVNPRFLQLKASLRSLLRKDGTFKHNKKAKYAKYASACAQSDDETADFETQSKKSNGKSAKEKKKPKIDSHDDEQQDKAQNSKGKSKANKYGNVQCGSPDDTSNDDANTDDTNTDDANTDDANTDDASTEGTSTDGTSTDGTSTDDTNTDDASTETTSTN